MDGRKITRLILAGGVVGPIFFIIVFLIEGATRPGYSAWRNYVSQLSTGENGWMQVANFIVCGLLIFGFAIALWRIFRGGRGWPWGSALLAVVGLGLIVAGVFVTDPALGYPPGSGARLDQRPQTVHGAIHGVAGLIVFSALAAACFVLSRRFASDPDWKGWAAYSVIAGTLVALGFIASTAASVLDERGVMPNAPTGLIQRIAIIAGFTWIALLALRLLRDPRLAMSRNQSLSQGRN